MRKILAMILTLAIILVSFCGCGSRTQTIETPNGEKIVIESTGKKIDGEFSAASVFSEGLAFVERAAEKGKTYCIDKSGNIIFDLDIDLSVNGDISASFTNGLAYVKEGFCDTSGKVTKPADVGATTFHYVATLKSGYLLAEVVTADYANTVKKLGVLNTKFEWTVEPSEKLYNEFANENGYSKIDSALNTSDYMIGDWYCNAALDKALNVKTGEVTTEKEKLGQPTSCEWALSYNGESYVGYAFPGKSTDGLDKKLTVDLSERGNICAATSFVNGKAAIVYHNTAAKTYYVTMIDEEGNHLFEPVETKGSSVQTDGEYILVEKDDYAEIFNDKGEKIGEIDVSADTSKSYSLQLSDGVILVIGGRIDMMSGYSGKAYYLDVRGKDLF